MSTVQTEQVMVVPTELFHSLGHFQGFCIDPDKYLDVLLDPANTAYLPRGEMEEDPSYKQLIPYVIIQHCDEDGAVHVFQYERGAGQGESRLHAKRSVGIGGHISTLDLGDASPYDEGMRRELDEEVIIDTEYDAFCVGMINDDENEVGKVHLGIVHLFNASKPNVLARESDIINAGFLPATQLIDEIDQFETWSQICLRELFG